jgi:hypothetical protein
MNMVESRKICIYGSDGLDQLFFTTERGISDLPRRRRKTADINFGHGICFS